jgi:hypothetical protein
MGGPNRSPSLQWPMTVSSVRSLQFAPLADGTLWRFFRNDRSPHHGTGRRTVRQHQIDAGTLRDRSALDGAIKTPIQDGNKRLAWLAMTTFLQLTRLVLGATECGEAAQWILDLRDDGQGLPTRLPSPR